MFAHVTIKCLISCQEALPIMSGGNSLPKLRDNSVQGFVNRTSFPAPSADCWSNCIPTRVAITGVLRPALPPCCSDLTVVNIHISIDGATEIRNKTVYWYLTF